MLTGPLRAQARTDGLSPATAAEVLDEIDRLRAEVASAPWVAIKKEREEIAELIRDLGDEEGFWRPGTTALGACQAIKARAAR